MALRIFWGALGGITLLPVARALLIIVPLSGILNVYEPTLAKACQKLDVYPGTEDIAVLQEQRRIFISAADRRNPIDADGAARGGIYTMLIDDPQSLKRVSPAEPSTYRPHGLDIYKDDDGVADLFAIMHDLGGDELALIYRIQEDGGLNPIETIKFDDMWAPNGIAAVGPRSFYVTNSIWYRSGLLSILEPFLALPTTSVAFYDADKGGRTVASGLAYANGIAISSDGSRIYVAEPVKRRVLSFHLDKASGNLDKADAFPLPTAPDNLKVDRDSHIWIGGSPKIFSYLSYANNPDAVAPAHVLKLNPNDKNVQTILYDGENRSNASSVGAPSGDVFYVGSVYDSHILKCAASILS